MNTTSIAPMLSVRNGARAIGLYKSAFGAGELFRLDAPDSAVVAPFASQGYFRRFDAAVRLFFCSGANFSNALQH